MNDLQSIKDSTKAYILDTFLPGEDPAALDVETSLILGGILDSIATLKLISFLEDRHQIEFEAHETGVDYLDTISLIAALIRRKLDQRG